jgi:hypothetical protein
MPDHHPDPGVPPTPSQRMATERSRFARALLPAVWLLAVSWLVLQATGRGLGRLHDWYVGGASALARAGVRVGRAVLSSLGPLGRKLIRLATPALRALRRAWDQVGLRVFLFLVRPLNRFRRWLLAHAKPVVDGVVRCARWTAGRLDPVLRMLGACTRSVERTAARLGRLLRRAWAPVARSVRAMTSPWSTEGR